MTSTAAPALPGFTVRPNGLDVRIECDTCRASWTGSLARTWAGSHSHDPDEAAYYRGQARLNDNLNRRELHQSDSFFGGPAATRPARDYLRSLLARSTDAELVADLRAYFNQRHQSGDIINACMVSCAIRLLGGR